MTLGEKVKHVRTLKKMTQQELAGDKITRNMLSEIESDKANPSLDTLKYIANKLGAPIPYFLSVEDDYYLYEKNELIEEIYRAYSAKSYKAVINLTKKITKTDDELNYILTSSYLALGKEAVSKGTLISASKYLSCAADYANKTVLDTGHLEAEILIYSAIAKNIQAPLLEFDATAYTCALEKYFDYEFYKYLTLDFEHEFRNKILGSHINAKKLIKEKNYSEACKLLNEAAEKITPETYNAYIVFGIYADLENCYKQLYDFENAYKYSSKRLSMIEGFKS